MVFDAATSSVRFRTRGRIVDHLKARGAVTAYSAAPLPTIRRSDQAVIGRLLRKGVIIKDRPGYDHLEEPVLDSERAGESTKMTGVLIAGAIVTVASVIALLR